MTVQNTVVKNLYAGNGSTTVFPYTFALNDEDAEYVKVYITDTDGVTTASTDFTIDLESQTVTYPASDADPLPTGYKIVLRRELPATQELNLENQGAFFAEDIEAEMDREVMMIQQLSESMDRCIKVDASSSQTADALLADIYAKSAAATAAAESAGNSATAAQGYAGDASDYAEAAAASAAAAEEAVDPSMVDNKISTHNSATTAHSTVISGAISTHDSASDAHADIRAAINNIDLSGRADVDLSNITDAAKEVIQDAAGGGIPEGADYVIDSYSDTDGNWWRKYKSGWIEQGGVNPSGTGLNPMQTTFLKAFSKCFWGWMTILPSATTFTTGAMTITGTTMTMSCANNAYKNYPWMWYACGQGASE